ncbi:YdiU family protein [Ahniella affigens]|uniref:Protein nucleotidyltransferase YdiU n=1 Tax=Ahniella affigens TaxID=2021234 RepID=A0A2P1PNA6_9GAMM|nr:YdiU family protein [Ahniella affigens]AVP96318.1 YdiU family protein [Ahniella affigens]
MTTWNLPTFASPFADLPIDPVAGNWTREVLGAIASNVLPTPVSAPHLLAWSKPVANTLGFSDALVQSDVFLQPFSGNQLWPGMMPLASNYGGHQFGHWAGQLGDGRAISLGVITAGDGSRQELQLKGAGPTPYSRGSDGRAVLRSSLREYLCSEAMHHLGVPTTRALSLIRTGDAVVRDMLYDGHPAPEPGAIVCRVAPSFIRFGHFELPARRGDTALLEALLRLTLRQHFPQWQDQPWESCLPIWFAEVAERTAVLIAHWMRVGFVHGVMNTDNLSILGLTIDYGPYGWLEEVDPAWTPNTTDAFGKRYCYGRQPEIAHWNLYCLAQALAPLLDDPEALQFGLKRYAEVFTETHRKFTLGKLGLPMQADLDAWLAELFRLLAADRVDFTRFFRSLMTLNPARAATEPAYWREHLDAHRYQPDQSTIQHEAWQAWLQQYLVLQDSVDPLAARASIQQHNPKFVFRNYLAQQAIDAATAGDMEPLGRLQHVLQNPYAEQPDAEDLTALRPDWASRKPGCSMLSCSS